MRIGKQSDARQVFTKSLKSLPKHKRNSKLKKDIKNLIKYAQMEYKLGVPEKGRTIFVGILDQYKKRTDLWSVYCDMEIKYCKDIDRCRRLFEEILQISWSSKKMKFFFKKYLDFEKAHGTSDGADHVKQLAVRYVESLA